MIDVSSVQVQQIPGAVCEKTVAFPQLSSFSFLDKVVHSASLCNDSAVWFRRLQTVLVRSSSLNVVDAPVLQVL